MMTSDLLALIGRDIQLRRTSVRCGGEYSGPCPLCRLGTDRFKVWPALGRWACLGRKAGRSGCDVGGDALQYLRRRDGLSYSEACARLGVNAGGGVLNAKTQRGKDAGGKEEVLCASALKDSPPAPLRPGVESSLFCVEPNPTWQAHAAEWAKRCAAHLWGEEGERARAYLHKRGLGADLLAAYHLGYNPQDVYEAHACWGLARAQDGARSIWLPRGITIPWQVAGGLWRLNIRRPLSAAQAAKGEAKYIGPAGFGNALYNADALAACPQRPVLLVEGELDALTIVQACGEEVTAIATGSTAGARRARWIAALRNAPLVLLAFDVDLPTRNGRPPAGDQAAAWWENILPNARRWQPWRHDINSMPDPDQVRRWVELGIRVRGGGGEGGRG